MNPNNIKIVKVDPTGFFVKKDEETISEGGSDDESTVSSASSVSSVSDSESEADLNPLPKVSTSVSVIKEGGTNVVVENKDDVALASNYLSVKPEEQATNSTPISSGGTPESSVESTESETEDTKSSVSNETSETNDTEEVIDMTDETLYTVLAAVLEDEDGNNVSENLSAIKSNLEKHNETLEKILGEYAESNRERAKEKRYFEQMTNAINNQNRMLERMVSVFEVFLKSSGVKVNQPAKIEEEDSDSEERKRRHEKSHRRIETPEHTGKFKSKISVSKI